MLPLPTVWSTKRYGPLSRNRGGRLWFGTDGGLSCLDDGALKNFTKEEGLAHNSVIAIVEDRAGRLWFATDGGGVSCYEGVRFSNLTMEKRVVQRPGQ